MLPKLLTSIFGSRNDRLLKQYRQVVAKVNALEATFEALSEDALRAKTGEFRGRVAQGESLDDLLPEAFATVREASKRTLKMRHFDVQMIGGMALHAGKIAEMRTGEGKTLTATLAVYLNSLAGKGVHLVTVNDYLVRRDAAWMGQLYTYLGLTVGVNLAQMSREEKQAAYAADITYGTNNEFGFDYLRDNMVQDTADRVARGLAYAIVDEVDSILIDEARTPLIISGRVGDAAKLYYRFASIVRSLKRDIDYEVEEDKKIVVPTDDGIDKVEMALGVANLYDEVQQDLVHQLQAALKAKELYRRDKEYIVAGGEVKIVDEFTGRILEGRRWSEGLHQAVEAKEGVKIKEENQTLATITLQNYFRMYEKLSGMTGTAQTEAAELMNTYGLQVVPVPTNREMVRADQADLIYKTEEAKFGAVVDDIVERVDRGQPVLVGTVSVEKSEYLSRLLDKRGVPHEVLNAKQHFREAEIITQAGQLGKVTVATNMAGRGVDILLGGNPENLAKQDIVREGLDPESDEGKALYASLLAQYNKDCKAEGDEVRKLGGLYVIGSERHESRRIDNQLRGRSGRQGDPGESRFYLSLDDELMRLFATGALSWVMGRALPDDEAIEAKMVSKAIERAQSTVEQRNAEIRKNVLKYDEVMNEQRKVIYQRRDQILEGFDLKSAAMEYLATGIDNLINRHCVSDVEEEWDLDGLSSELTSYYPTTITPEQLEDAGTTDKMYGLVMAEATAYYNKREEDFTPEVMRQVERHVMLQMIDQRWREHLQEMDYLQEGINLRAMGQKDPLVEWQREGFEMFGQLMKTIADDFVRYIMHVEVVVNEPETATVVKNLTTSSADDVNSNGFAAAAQAAAAAGEIDPELAATAAAPASTKQQTVVKSEFDKTPRNAPCPCGSGKKYKLCHGATNP